MRLLVGWSAHEKYRMPHCLQSAISSTLIFSCLVKELKCIFPFEFGFLSFALQFVDGFICRTSLL